MVPVITNPILMPSDTISEIARATDPAADPESLLLLSVVGAARWSLAQAEQQRMFPCLCCGSLYRPRPDGSPLSTVLCDHCLAHWRRRDRGEIP